MALSSIHELEGFNERIELYITKFAANQMYDHCLSCLDTESGAIGFLAGDMYTWKEKTYIVVIESFSSIEKIEALDDRYMLVGWYYLADRDESPEESKIVDIEKKLLNEPYCAIIGVNPNERKLMAYKLVDNRYMEIACAITKDIKYPAIEEQIYIGDEIASVKETTMLLEFLILSFFSVLFGIFGGLLGFFVARDHGSKAYLLLLIGIVSTIFWFMIGQAIV